MPVARSAARRLAGLGALAPLLLPLLLLAACGREGPAAQPNALVISLDTTRADRLGAYGYERATSPNLDALAAEGTVFERAYTVATWTLPAHASLFTGRLPRSHGAQYDPGGPLVLGDAIRGPGTWQRIRARGLGADERTLAELLGAHGYRTAGVVAGPWMKAVFGLGRGFEHWDDFGITSLNGRPAASVTDAAIRWLEADDPRPFLLFVNYFEPHSPLLPQPACLEQVAPRSAWPQGEARTTAELSLLYDGEIRCMDDELGRLLGWLREAGHWDDTLVVAVADHGELLGEQGATGHGASLFEPELRIPLIVKPPRGAALPAHPDQPLLIANVFPLVLAALGIEAPAAAQAAWPPAPDEAVVAEVHPIPPFGRRGSWRALVDGALKYLESEAGDRLLFDVVADPAERRDLAAARPAQAAALRERLAAYLAALPRPAAAAGVAPVEVDDETRRALESLGYLERAPDADAAGEPPPPADPDAAATPDRVR